MQEKEFKRFMMKPNAEMYPGIKVTKDTELEHKTEKVEQTVKDLVFHSVTRLQGDNYVSILDTTIQLAEGDVLLFEPDGRGYVKPVEEFMSVTEAIEELKCIEDLQ